MSKIRWSKDNYGQCQQAKIQFRQVQLQTLKQIEAGETIEQLGRVNHRATVQWSLKPCSILLTLRLICEYFFDLGYQGINRYRLD